MTAQFIDERPNIPMREGRRKIAEVSSGAAATMALGGAASAVLAILGLAGALSDSTLDVLAIILGATLLLRAGTSAVRRGAVAPSDTSGAPFRAWAPMRGGVSAGTLAGLAGIALGILALLHVAPIMLSTVALIAFGGALVLDNEAIGRFASAAGIHPEFSGDARVVVHESWSSGSGGEVLVGIAAAVLGILSLTGVRGVAPATLLLVGFLAMGFALLAGGLVLGSRAFSVSRRHAGGSSVSSA